MSTTTTDIFVSEYEGATKAAYQRTGSLIRGTINTIFNVRGSTVYFPTVGKGSATRKTRHGEIPPMNLTWDQVPITIEDIFAGDFIDDLDQLKTNVDMLNQTSRAAAMALGRETDDTILTAMQTATNSNTLAVATREAFLNSVIESVEELMAADVPIDAGIYALISPRMWSWMMKNPEFTSSDYTGPNLQPFTEGGRALQGKTWFGVHWITHSGLPKSGNNRTGFLYHRDAIGHAIQKDITGRATFEGTRDAWWVYSKMAHGAGLIDDTGVIKLVLDESQPLPTS